ncbi:MAG: manganese-binding transcriptional regulator MntR [Planctomycetaceae bacterium]
MKKRSTTNQHVRTRTDHATELAEDYVEAIAEFTEKSGTCRGVDLATQFGVTNVTVNRMVGRLVRDGYATTTPYGPVELTEKGRKLAAQCRRRHEIVFSFLLCLGVDSATAAIDAEGIEHHVSTDTLAAMKAFVKNSGGRGG